jgi:hypothetical protein
MSTSMIYKNPVKDLQDEVPVQLFLSNGGIGAVLRQQRPRYRAYSTRAPQL